MEIRTAPAPAGTSRRPMALREVPPAERSRERLQARGAGDLTTAELIALVWGSGSRGLNAVNLAERTLNRPDFSGDSTVWRTMESWQNTARIRPSGDIHRN